MKITAPPFESLNDYYKTYWKYLNEEDVLSALAKQGDVTMKWLFSISEMTANFAYAEGKWMIKEVIGHLSDTERILSYRALQFARNDNRPIPGFDENKFIMESNFRDRTLKDISMEWQTVRAATISLFSSMTHEIVDRTGFANGLVVSPRIILFFIYCHERHHTEVIKERYLTKAFSA